MPSSQLAETLTEIRARIEKSAGRRINEQNTKATLIEPLLRALGWDTEDVDEVQREYKIHRRDKPVDYALLAARTPQLFLEAKALGENLDDRRWANQMMGYAAVAGVDWIVLTDGDEYRIYCAHASVPVEEKLFRTVRVSKGDKLVEPTLKLLAKEHIAERAIEILWRAQFVDRQVQAALEEMFDPEFDMVLVNHLAMEIRNLTVPEIRASLARCDARFEFPIVVDIKKAGLPPQDEKEKGGGSTTSPNPGPRTYDVSLRDLIEAHLIKPPLELRRRYKGQEFRARIEADGAVVSGDERHSSPSAAGCAARATIIGKTKSGGLPPTNGWSFWRYVGPDGKEHELDEIRKRFLASQEEGPATGTAAG